jgi:hypothetical protein
MTRLALFCLPALIALGAAPAAAVPVPSFNGSYDEATGPEAAGDYDNIGGLTDVGNFALFAGSNTFAGSVFTPGDSSDPFNIVVGPFQTLVGARIVFAENATPFNPFFGIPAPNWTLTENTTTPLIFEIALGPSGATEPQTFIAPAFSRGPGIYGVLIGNGTFGMNNGAPVDYTMTFQVKETLPPPPPPIPLPATLPLLLGGLAGLVAAARRRRA